MMTFIILAVFLIASSLLVIFKQNPVHSALSLVASLFIMAVLFLTLQAPMVAVLQIFVYAGAIMVLFLFVIMLFNPGMPEKGHRFWRGLGFLGAVLLALELIALLLSFRGQNNSSGGPQVGEAFGSPKMLAESLFTDFVLPFEIASILLLVALIGAVVLAKREP